MEIERLRSEAGSLQQRLDESITAIPVIHEVGVACVVSPIVVQSRRGRLVLGNVLSLSFFCLVPLFSSCLLSLVPTICKQCRLACPCF